MDDNPNFFYFFWKCNGDSKVSGGPTSYLEF